jgi:hypothetical protein
MFQDLAPLPEDQSFARQFSNWPQGQGVAQFANPNEPTRQEGVWLYAQVKTRKLA